VHGERKTSFLIKKKTSLFSLFFHNGFVWKTCDENVAFSLSFSKKNQEGGASVIMTAKGKITIFFKSRQTALKNEKKEERNECGTMRRKKFFILSFSIQKKKKKEEEEMGES
jgi:hypothetical protein